MNPIPVFVGTFVGGAGAAQSGFVTFSYANSNNFDAFAPVVITCPGTTAISAGAEVQVYRSSDGGTTWATEGSYVRVFSKPTAAGQVQRGTVRLPTGLFLLSVQIGGGCASTWTAQVQTAWVHSAYS